jgi:hypothetical protein
MTGIEDAAFRLAMCSEVGVNLGRCGRRGFIRAGSDLADYLEHEEPRASRREAPGKPFPRSHSRVGRKASRSAAPDIV